ncbi:MAG: magnesium/cobalt transporter CorA [Candidatus Omnitrophica bacterium]|nr:magnesium/cobalt transporter CorA [Candidatus Omnitrophota bacterium]
MLELLLYENDGNCRVIEKLEDIKKEVKNKDALLWLNVEKPTEKDMELLIQCFNFHPLAIEDCLTSIQRPKIDRYDDYLFIVLHAATLSPHKDKATSLELDTFIGQNFIVTVHMKPIKSVASARSRCIKNPQILSKGPAHLFYTIADSLVDNYFPILAQLDKDIEKTEQLIFKDHASENVSKILNLKEIVLTLRRFIGPQREIVNFLARGDYQPTISADLSIYFRDIADLLARISDTLDGYRDILTNILDGFTSVTSNKLNEIMKVLTIIATIMMPLTLVTGIYGMNFQFMPELNWKYGYFVILFIMLSIGGSMLLYFKHKKWL